MVTSIVMTHYRIILLFSTEVLLVKQHSSVYFSRTLLNTVQTQIKHKIDINLCTFFVYIYAVSACIVRVWVDCSTPVWIPIPNMVSVGPSLIKKKQIFVFVLCLLRFIYANTPLFLPSISFTYFVISFLLCESSRSISRWLMPRTSCVTATVFFLGPLSEPVAADSLGGSLPLLAFDLWFELWIRQFYGLMSFCHWNGWEKAGFGGHLIVNLWVFAICYKQQSRTNALLNFKRLAKI